jgi:nicotinate-nucleotide--dimethylbenzimidazole phosphoribosyltransferase
MEGEAVEGELDRELGDRPTGLAGAAGADRRGPAAWVVALAERFEAVLFDVGGTLVEQAPPHTPVEALEPRLLPGAFEALRALRGALRLGVVSNTTVMDGETLRDHLDRVGVGELFETVVATADLGVHKPDPEPIRAALASMGLHPSKVLYVGDDPVDRDAAAGAGVAFCFTGVDLRWTLQRYATRSEPVGSTGSPAVPARPPLRGSDPSSVERCRARFDRLAKPPGALGILEETLARMAGIARSEIPPVDPVACAVFVGDHGVAEGDVVTPWPWTITRQVAALLAEGRGLAATLARSAGVHLEVVDVGLATGPTPDGVRDERVRSGTADIRFGPTMEPREAVAALDVGERTAERLVAAGHRTLCVGEVGIGNTTAAAALIAWLTGGDPVAFTGRGSGIPDDAFERKRAVVAGAVAAVPRDAGVMEALCRLGGLEIAAMAGFVVGAASIGVPVIIDGVIALAAACVADALVPGARDAMLAAHRSPEPATVAALEWLGLRPLLDLRICTGEGGGAVLAVPLLRAAREALVGTALLDEL